MRFDVAASTPAPAPALDADRRIRLWTAERVPLVVPLAGLGERALAYVIDVGLLLTFCVAAVFVYNFWGDLEADMGGLSALGTLALGLALFGGACAYDVLFEVLGSGRTPGKRLMGLRVIDARGRAPDLFTAVLRNLLRLVDLLPFGYAVGTASLFVTGTRRVGDIVADTFVVTERSSRHDPVALCHALHQGHVHASAVPVRVRHHVWSDAMQAMALEVIERTAPMDSAAAGPACLRVLRAVDGASAAGVSVGEARAVLAWACLRQAEAPRGMLAQIARLVAAEAQLTTALARLTHGAGLPDVEAADHAIRHAATELMRAERRGVPARHREALSLALLAAERRRVPQIEATTAVRHFFSREIPQAVWSERALIARAGAVLSLGIFVGGAVAWADGQIARALVGDDVARMIDAGARWTDQIEHTNAFAAASLHIIVNNVGVGLRVFAFGLLGGVATLVGLVSNGIHVGAILGYAIRIGTAETLLRFILAHGPVELTMIAVAGAAGLCLGRAIVSPGAQTRVAALRQGAARGVRLVAAATLGFVCIGTVEGFVSPGALFPSVVNATVGMGLLALFWTWIVLCGRSERQPLPSA